MNMSEYEFMSRNFPELPSGWRWSPSPQGYPMATNTSGTTSVWVDHGRLAINNVIALSVNSAPADVVSTVLAEYNGRLDP